MQHQISVFCIVVIRRSQETRSRFGEPGFPHVLYFSRGLSLSRWIGDNCGFSSTPENQSSRSRHSSAGLRTLWKRKADIFLHFIEGLSEILQRQVNRSNASSGKTGMLVK